MRVLLTGHDGYIGAVMSTLLIEKGHDVTGLDCFLFEGCDFGGAPPKIPEIRKDIRDVEVADLEGFDAVIHLAAISNDPLGNLNPQGTYDINHIASVHLAKLAKEAGVERFPTMLAVWRGLATSSLMALAGLLTFIVWITPDPSPRTIRLARILAVVAPILLAVHVGAWIRSTTPPGGLDLPWIRALLGSSGSGRAETTRFLCALAALIALWRRHEGTAAILTLTAVGVSGAIGHALAVDRMLSVPTRSAHLLAAALWFGGLLVLITSQKDRPEFRSQVRRISAIALASVVAIAFTGLVQSVLLLPSPAGLVTTIYGRAVLAKTAGLIILIAFGATNRRLFMPRLADGHGATALQRSCTVETWVMIAVILLAGFLSYIPIPE